MKYITFLFALLTQFLSAQNYTEYATGSSSDVTTNHEFGICMMGGASENDNAMTWFLNKADGGDVVVLRASGSDGYNDYFYSDLGVSINSVTTFVINNEAGATNSYVLEKVANAEAIWFAGGDQFDYVSYFKDNAMEEVLNNFINNKRGVIGGTSAGMAILGSAYFSAENGTVTNAQALSNPYHNRMTLGYNDFLDIPFLEHVITDTHYDDPDRRARHAAFLARYATDNGLASFGIACNEYTAVCINEFGEANVYGDYPNYDEFAYFVFANCNNFTYWPETCVEGQPLTWNRDGEAIKVYTVPGTQTGENFFDLNDYTSGSGGSWGNWTINNGTFSTSTSTNPLCSALSISENEILEVSVGPNPFRNSLTIQSQLVNFDVMLYDGFGKRVAQFKNQSQIDTSILATGLYFLRIYSEGLQETFKLVKD
ncbi:T9SS type A sorting domain-containing protein [Psychroserpens mesophilus]|uniref:T9SS type A sorting domain-containing protein n=1 Tax=Psychroserpens mesophilus TaxID=325473 RepID=UPI003D64D19A